MKTSIPLYLLSLGTILPVGAAVQTWQNSDADNTWNSSSQNWDADATWTNGNDAVFGGTAETVTIGTDALTAGTITMNGTTEWVFAGAFDNLTANTIAIATTGNGKLSFKSAGALNNVGSITVANGTTLFLGALFTLNSDVTVLGTGNGEARGALRIEGDGVIAGNVTLTGNTTIGSAGNGFISGDITAANFSLSRSSVGTGTLTLSGSLGLGSGGFTQAIAGTTVLNGTSSYSGATTISAGKLTLGGTLTNSTVSVASGASLDGAGSAAGITLASGANVLVNTAVSGSLDAAGTLAVTGTANLVLSSVPSPGTYTLLTYGSTAATTANFAVNILTGLPSDHRGSGLSVSGGSVSLGIDFKDLVWSGNSPTWEIGGAENDWNSGADNFYNLDKISFDDSGANPAITINGTVAPQSMAVSGSTNNYNFSGSGSIGGITGLAKSGSSILTLRTLNNSYTGATTISGGTVILDNTAGTGAQTQLSGVSGNVSIAASTTLGIKVGGAGMDGSSYFMGRPLTGSGALVLENAGATGSREINLSGVNTGFSGSLGMTRSSGTSVLRVRATQMSNSTQIAVANGCQFWDVTASGQTVGYTFTNLAGAGEGGLGALRPGGGVTYSGGIAIDAAGGRIGGAGGATLLSTFSGQITGGPLELLGTSNAIGLVLTNNSNAQSSTTIVSGSTGAVRAGGNGIFGTGTLTQNGATLMSSSTAARSFANAYVVNGNITLGDATNNGKLTFSSTVGLGAATRTIATASDVAFSGVVSNGGIIHTGAAKLTLSGAGSLITGLHQQGTGSIEISGTTTITGGTTNLQTSTLAGTAPIDILAGGILNVNPGAETIIAQNTANHTGVLSVSGTFSQTSSNFFLGNNVATATGILNINNGGKFTFDSAGLFIIGRDLANGTINLNSGGELLVNKVVQGDTGAIAGNANAGTSRVFNFNGGTFTALADAADIAGMLTATITGTATVNTNGFNMALSQGFAGAGGLNKTAAGTLRLNGANTYAGTTTVINGTLGGTGSIAGALTANSGTTVAPGASIGTFTVGGAADINGALAIEINGSSGDKLTVGGALDIAQTDLDITAFGSGATENVYVIASYGSLTGTQFATVDGLPGGYSINYAYNNGISSNNIALVKVADAYDSYELANNIVGAGADVDSDGDGIANGIEFVLGGVSNPALHSNDSNLLPTATAAGANVVFSFRLTNDAASLSPTPWSVEFDADLAGTWTTAQHGVNSTIAILPDGGNPWSNVTVTIPKAGAPKIFARLRVTIP